MTKLIKTTLLTGFVTLCLILGLSPLPTVDAGAAFQTGKSLYSSKCSVCHGPDGSGNTAKGKELKVRNWLTDAAVKALTDAQLTEIISKGKGKMEGYEKSLGKDKVALVVTYTKELINKPKQ
jgi:mono/diheme cytochrome c family protein